MSYQQIPDLCPRCRGPMRAHSMSFFNTQHICTRCHREEQLLPNYQKARDAEEAALRGGDHNYPGIGLAPEDYAKIHQLLAARVGAEE